MHLTGTFPEVQVMPMLDFVSRPILVINLLTRTVLFSLIEEGTKSTSIKKACVYNSVPPQT